MKAQLQHHTTDENNLSIKNVIDTIDVVDHSAGLKDELLSHHKRDQYLKQQFHFIEPKKVIIGSIRNEICFYYSLSVFKTLGRLLKDKSLY